uniref:Ig-like domain-containing protein n=1 Tax=Cyprinodon variegatus TaxID=28743 RepID=A0A3Q2EB03_CYPVA
MKLLYVFVSVSSESRGQVTTPGSRSVVLGQTVSIRCKTNSSVSSFLSWYLQKDGESPKLLIYRASSHEFGIPGHFSGILSRTAFILTISGVEAEDAGVHYCQQYRSKAKLNKQKM